jgi:acetylornithine deacetylase
MPTSPAPRHSDSSTDLLAQLVGFDTTSRDSNLALIGMVRAYLDRIGVAYRLSSNPAGDKANMHVIIGPQTAGGVALSGHVDTVPVDGQAWTADPFALRAADGRLYGRGTADMKGFVACCLAAVPELMRRELRKPVHLFITYDEETNCAGARRLIADLQDSQLVPQLCIVGEPSGMKPVIAHKGKLSLRVRAKGKPGHSSEPARGVNAVQAAAEAVAWLAGEARRLAAEGPFEDGFDPPHTTAHVGTMSGGTIANIIPEHAEFTVEWRAIPADDLFDQVDRLRAHVAAQIEPAMRAVDPACGFSYEVTGTLPGLSLDADHELTALVKQLTGSNSVGKVSYGTEGGLYAAAGIPTIICGPGHIAQAHQPDEWIDPAQLALCDSFIRRLADRFCM